MPILLINSLDARSRAFVEALSPGHDYEIVDWYVDKAARYAYVGPPPSDFPSVVVDLPDDMQGLIRCPADPDDAEAKLADAETYAESVVPVGTYIGGVTLVEAEENVDSPAMPPVGQRAMAEKLSEIKQELKAAVAEKLADSELSSDAKTLLESAKSASELKAALLTIESTKAQVSKG